MGAWAVISPSKQDVADKIGTPLDAGARFGIKASPDMEFDVWDDRNAEPFLRARLAGRKSEGPTSQA